MVAIMWRSPFRLLALVPLLLLTGCESFAWKQTHYYRVVLLERDGSLIAAYTARGYVYRREDGYRLTAVERCTPNPPREVHYPLGWRIHTQCAKTVIYEVGKPAWMVGLTPWNVADGAQEVVCHHQDIAGFVK